MGLGKRACCPVGLLCVAVCVAAVANELPVSAFTDDPELGLISISPNGDYLARSKRDGEYGTFQVVTYPGREVKINYGLGRHTEVGGMTWFDDDRLLITGVRFVLVLDLRVPTGELHVVEVESGKMDLLARGGALMHQLPDEPDHVLILRYNNRFAEAHRMNVKNGHLRRIARTATRGGNLLANAEGKLEFSACSARRATAGRRGHPWYSVPVRSFGTPSTAAMPPPRDSESTTRRT